MSCPFGRPSCFLQVSLIAEREIRACLSCRIQSITTKEKDSLRAHARNGIFRDRRSHIKLCLDELLDAQSGQASLIGTIAPFPLPFRSRSCTLSLAFMVGKTSQEVLDGVPGRGKGIQCLRRQQKCKLEVTDILRGVFIGRNSSTHPAQRFSAAFSPPIDLPRTHMPGDKKYPTMKELVVSHTEKEANELPDEPRRLDWTIIDAFMKDGTFYHSPLSEKEATTGSSLSDFPLHQT
ncbi:hypothetical protein V6N13_034914 [Hibiscus sabdariffa]